MAPPGRPFSDSEKHKLLSDILRTSNVEINDVMRLIVERNVRPPWDDMPLPEGRTLNDCRAAFEEMLQAYRHAEIQSPQFADTRYDPYSSSSSAPPSAGPTPYHLSTTLPHMRPIQPRPPVATYTAAPADPSVQQYTPTILEPPQKRRGRGRPSKETLEAERREYAAQGRDPPPPKQSRKRKDETTSPQSTSYPQIGTNTPYSTSGPEQSGLGHGQGQQISPVGYTLAGGEAQRVDPRDPNRWAETVGYSTASSSAVRQLPIAGPSSDPHRGTFPPPPTQYANSPRIAATQQERTHSRSPSTGYRQPGGQ